MGTLRMQSTRPRLAWCRGVRRHSGCAILLLVPPRAPTPLSVSMNRSPCDEERQREHAIPPTLQRMAECRRQRGHQVIIALLGQAIVDLVEQVVARGHPVAGDRAGEVGVERGARERVDPDQEQARQGRARRRLHSGGQARGAGQDRRTWRQRGQPARPRRPRSLRLGCPCSRLLPLCCSAHSQ